MITAITRWILWSSILNSSAISALVGRMAQDQVADYAKRKGWTLAEAERWLGPNLGYNPED